MHLESLLELAVAIDALGRGVPFEASETIHTETSAKYSDDRVERSWARQASSAGERSATTQAGRFGLHLRRAA